MREARMSARARDSVRGAFLGYAVDYFDIYLPVVALAPAMAYFQPRNLPDSIETTLFYLVFATTLLGRPIGAIVFGQFADRIGRKRVTNISVGGFAIVTLATALLPGYRTWGLAALLVLIAMRLLDGFFLGGEYTSNNTLAIEVMPKRLRGVLGGLLASAFPTAYVAISLVTAVLLHFLPASGVDSPYVQWGWRIPFVVGAGLAVAFLLYYRRVPESQAWMEAAKSESPLRELLRGAHLRDVAQIFVMMTGFWFTTQAVSGVLPGLLITTLKLPSALVTNGILVATVVLFGGYVGAGALSQAIGRRLTITLFGLSTLVLGCGLYWALVTNALRGGPIAVTIALAGVVLVLTVSPWGIATTYINERFPTRVRSSGYGVGYSLAVVIPSFYSFYLLGLSHLMPYPYTQIVLLAISGVLIVVGSRLGPETRDVDMVPAAAEARA